MSRPLVLACLLLAAAPACSAPTWRRDVASGGNAFIRAIHAVCAVADRIPDNAIPMPAGSESDAGAP